MTTLFTIGHSNHRLEHFVGLLLRHDIRQLVDVRSQPYSRRHPHFSKPRLAGQLASEGVVYQFRGDALGGRPAGAEWYDAAGRLDYGRRSSASDYCAGIAELCVLAAGRRTAIMCAEEDPDHCHRRRLLTPSLVGCGLVVVHLRGDGSWHPEAADLFGR